MKFALKRFKNYPRMSEETEAFNADVFYEGVLVGSAENGGRGGSTFVRLNPKGREIPEVVAADAMPEFANGAVNEDSLGQIVDNLVEQLLKAKWLEKERKKVVKKLAANVLFNRKGDKDGTFRTYNLAGKPFDEVNLFAKKVAGQPDVSRVLNLMPFDDAFQLLVRAE